MTEKHTATKSSVGRNPRNVWNAVQGEKSWIDSGIHRVHRVATATFGSTFHLDGKISPGGWGQGGGVRAHPHSLYLPSRTKLWCTLQLRRQIHSPPYLYSTPIWTLWWYPMMQNATLEGWPNTADRLAGWRKVTHAAGLILYVMYCPFCPPWRTKPQSTYFY